MYDDMVYSDKKYRHVDPAILTNRYSSNNDNNMSSISHEEEEEHCYTLDMHDGRRRASSSAAAASSATTVEEHGLVLPTTHFSAEVVAAAGTLKSLPPIDEDHGVLLEDQRGGGSSSPPRRSKLSEATLSPCRRMNSSCDHSIMPEEIATAAAVEHDDHGRNNNHTTNRCKRPIKRRALASSSTFSHRRRRNLNMNSNNRNIAASVMICLYIFSCIGIVTTTTNTALFVSATTAAAAATSAFSSLGSTAVTTTSTTVAPLSTTTTTTTATTAAVTTTSTIGGIKLVDDDYDDLNCTTFNKGQCQQKGTLICIWNTTSLSCDFQDPIGRSTLPPVTTQPPTPATPSPPTPLVTTSPPTSPPTIATPPPVTGPTGGNKQITETPTIDSTTPVPTTKSPTPLPTPVPTTKSPTSLPTPVPTTKSPTPLPTPVPTTKSPTPLPTPGPTTKSPTPEPTLEPTVTPTKFPTKSPTPLPTPKPSSVPSVSPTWKPSIHPTDVPSLSPSASPTAFPSTSPSFSPTTSPKPTPLIWPSASPTISSSPTSSPSDGPSTSPSISPSSSPTMAPTTLSPLPAGVTFPPSPPPTTSRPTTSRPTSSNTRRIVLEEPTSITLKNSYKMKEDSAAYQVWYETTQDRIARYAQEMIEKSSGEKDVDVIVKLDDVRQRGSSSYGPSNRTRRLGGTIVDNGGRKRNLQEEGLNPLRITFYTTLEFYSKQSKWDGVALVGAGFITVSQQDEYISDLKKGQEEAYRSVNSMAMSVNGQVVTKTTDDNKNIDPSGNSMTYIIAGAVAGVLVLFAFLGGTYYIRRRRNDSYRTAGSSSKYPDKKSSQSSSFYNNPSSTMMSSPPTKSFPPPPPQNASPVGDYFGTIEPKMHEDDVSTLGDPYIGEVVANQVMDHGDNTVTESLMSSGNDMYVYGVSRPRIDTGDSSSRFTGGGGSTVRMTFQDDGTIENFYNTSDRTNFHSEKDSNFEHITVVASSGVLGIVIDNPTRHIPIVHAIKETSVLHGRVNVGDLLLSVDEVDCVGMTAVAVSQLISSRSRNPNRTLRLLRGADSNDVRGDSSAF